MVANIFGTLFVINCNFVSGRATALAEWLRRVPAKYMGFPRESSNLSGVVPFFRFSLLFSLPVVKLHQKHASSLFLDHFPLLFYFPSLSSNCIRNILMIAVAVL